jgi:hypothetical protein
MPISSGVAPASALEGETPAFAPPSPTWTRFKTRHVLVLLLVVAGGHLAFRAAILGMPPYTDSGVYACMAYFVAEGESVVPNAPINLYPSLLSVVGCHPDAPLFRFRLADAVVCAMAAGITSLLLYRLGGFWPALLLGMGWSLAWLHPVIGNDGLKNPIVPAFGCLSGALLLFSHRNRWAILAGGALIPLMVLLREPLAVASLALLASSMVFQGRRGLAYATLGGSISGCLLLTWVWLFRGSPQRVLEYFGDVAVVFDTLYQPNWEAIARSWSGGKSAMLSLWLCGLLGGAAALARHRAAEWRLLLIAGLLFVFPLPEILFKLPFPYHWMQAGLALAILSIAGLRACGRVSDARSHAAVPWWANAAVGLVLAGSFALNYPAYQQSLRAARYFAPVMVHGDWDHPCVSQCFYLTLAKYIRENTESDQPILVSGWYYVLYPLSQRMPPDVRIFDLSIATLAKYPERRPEWIEQAKAKTPPAVVVETLRDLGPPPKYADFVRGYPENYALGLEVPTDTPIRYAHFGARVWKATAPIGEALAP